MSRRFLKFERELRNLIAKEDAFGLKFRQSILNNEAVPSPINAITDNLTGNSRWAYSTTPEQLDYFRVWLETQIAHDIFQRIGVASSWADKYIQEAYLKGQARGFDEAVKAPLWTGVSPQTSSIPVRQALRFQYTSSPISVQGLQLLEARVQTELKGATDAMSQQLSRELLDGMVRNLTPTVIAASAINRVRKVGLSRALVTVQTEIVRANAEGVLDALESLGVTEVETMVEWQTGSNPCPACQALKGVVMTIAKARGLFPRHPRCRCSPIPATSRRTNREQVRGRRKVMAAMHRSIRAEYPRRSLSKAKAKSKWSNNIN